MNLKALGFDGTLIIHNRCDNIDDLCGGDPEKCSLLIMMHSLRDPSQAPEGMATVQLVTPFPYNYMGYWKREMDGTRGKEYTELKEALADKLIASAWLVPCPRSQAVQPEDAYQKPLPGGPLDIPWLWHTLCGSVGKKCRQASPQGIKT
jgi:hypothetical protein